MNRPEDDQNLRDKKPDDIQKALVRLTTVNTMTDTTHPEPQQGLRTILAKLADWQGYYDEAKQALPEDVSKFIDDASWAGELHKEKRIDLALADAMQLIEQTLYDCLPEKKTLETDLPLDADEDDTKFCVECGAWEYEGELDCKCVGFNNCIDVAQANFKRRMK